jgi:pimeloyl-ACP methyl ester carboxylesterase
MSDFRSLSRFDILKMPRILARIPFNINKLSWTVDDHIHMDTPAIIKFIKSFTGSRQITWVGHSMGGMIMYAYLETEDPEDVKRFVAVGTSVNVKQPPNPLLAMVASQKPVTNASLLINTTVASQLRNFTLGTLKLPWEDLFYNKDNMDELTAIKMFRVAIDDTSPGVIAQYSEMIKSGDFMSSDKSFNYTKNLDRVKKPVLIAAGSKDRMGSVESARFAFENISSEDKEAIIFSRTNGYSADYGHCDLILGKNSEEEVYNYIYRWLERK